MNCDRVSGLIAVQRELDRAQRRAVAEHMRRCPACRAAWRDEQRLQALVAAATELVPPRGLEARLLAIPGTVGPGPSRAIPGLHAGTAAIGIVALAVVIGLLYVATAERSQLGATAPRGVPAGLASPTVVARLASVPERRTGDPAGAVAGRSAPERAGAPGDPMAAAEDPLPAAAAFAIARNSVGADRGGVPPFESGGPAESAAVERGGDPSERPDPRTSAARAAPQASPAVSPPAPPPAAPPTAPPVAPTTAPPADPTTAPEECIEATVSVFADLVGGGAPGCPGCDGAWGPQDEALARSAGVVLPGFQVAVYDARGSVLFEQPLTPTSAYVRLDLPSMCGPLPLTVQIVGLTAGWAACPGHDLQMAVDAPGPAELFVPLTTGCPVVPSPSPGIAAGPSPPGETPDPDVTATAHPTATAAAHTTATTTAHPTATTTAHRAATATPGAAGARSRPGAQP